MDIKTLVDKRVHDYYWKDNIDCAITTLKILGEIFLIDLEPQVLNSAIGLFGAGGFQAQCGLVEGALMFIGILGKAKNYSDNEIKEQCYSFTEKFEKEFGSLICKVLRPEGFKPENPPHLCEDLSKKAILFTINFLSEAIKKTELEDEK